jgi:hypothetical protein
MQSILKKEEVSFAHSSVEDWSFPADFVLCFGLLYHVENPIQVIRKLATLTKHTLCLETEVVREHRKTFLVLRDPSAGTTEGGATEFCMRPSLGVLEYLLSEFGFTNISCYTPTPEDYHEIREGTRVILTAEK